MAVIIGGAGDDNLVGTATSDRIITGAGKDSVDAGGGADDVWSTDADGVLDGGSGIDLVRILRSNAVSTAFTIDLSTSGNVANIGDGTELRNMERIHFVGGSGDDWVMGGDYADLMEGGDGNDYLNGGGGSDKIYGGMGDTLIGGAGNDRIFVYNAPVLVDGGSDNDIVTLLSDVTFADGSVVNVENFEIVDGVRGDFSGLDMNIRLTVVSDNGIGVNVLGSERADTLRGGTGNDTLAGGRGNDVIAGGDGNDTIDGGMGVDTMSGGEGDDTLVSKFSEAGPDIIDGGNGVDTAIIDRVRSTETFTIDLGISGVQDIGDGTTITNIEVLRFDGGSGNDTVTGGAGADHVSGGDGNDTFYGMGGNDRFTGGAGDDTFIGGSGLQDTGVYLANYVDANFDVTFTVATGTLTIVSEFGTDTFRGVEQFRFNDRVVTPLTFGFVDTIII